MVKIRRSVRGAVSPSRRWGPARATLIPPATSGLALVVGYAAVGVGRAEAEGGGHRGSRAPPREPTITGYHVAMGPSARDWPTDTSHHHRLTFVDRRTYREHRRKVLDMSSQLRAPGPDGVGTAGGRGQRSLMAWQVLSALFLLAMGAIHLYLALTGVTGLLGILFILNAVGALALAIAVVVLRRRLLLVACVLSVLFTVGTLLALVLALTVGLFGIGETLHGRLVPTALVVESVGAVVLLVTSALVRRRQAT